MDMKTELSRLILWNASMAKTLNDCSHTASSWIRQMIDLNKEIISELKLELKYSTI